MSRLLGLTMIIGLLCLPVKINAQYQIIELADVQLAKSLSAVVQDPVGSPLTSVLVQEFSPDWKTVLRTSATDDHGRFRLRMYKVERFTAYNYRHPGLTRCVCASR